MSEREKKGKKRLLAPSLPDLEKYNAQISARYGYLLVKQMEFERRQRNKAMRLAKKNEKQARLWVI